MIVMNSYTRSLCLIGTFDLDFSKDFRHLRIIEE